MNAPARLHAILSRGANITQDNLRVIDVWAQLMNITDPANSVRRQLEVTRSLGLLLSQLDDTRGAAATTRLRVDRYKNQLDQIQNALNPSQLFNTWNHVRQHLSTDAVLVLGLLADTLPPDQEALGEEVLGQILEDLRDLEALVERLPVDPELRRFVLTQLDAIRLAMRDFRIQGGVALRKAFERSTWEWQWQVKPETKNPAADRRVLARLRSVWVKVVAVTSAVSVTVGDTAKFVENVEKVLSKVPAVMKQIEGLPKPIDSSRKMLPRPESDLES